MHYGNPELKLNRCSSSVIWHQEWPIHLLARPLELVLAREMTSKGGTGKVGKRMVWAVASSWRFRTGR